MRLLAVAVVLLVVVAAAGWLLRSLSPAKPKDSYRRKPLLSQNEKDFYRALVAAVGRDAIIFAQVPIGSFATPKRGSENYQGARNRIDRKTVDFVLIDPQSLDPIAAIEVDDRSHESERAKARDALVNAVLKDIDLRLHRFPASRTYSPVSIRAALFPEGRTSNSPPNPQPLPLGERPTRLRGG